MATATWTQVNTTLLLIRNLHNAALEHLAHCDGPHCAVSLFDLRRAAEVLYQRESWHELADEHAAKALIEAMPL